MRGWRLNNTYLGRLLEKVWPAPARQKTEERSRQTHVVLLDGTMSSLDEGMETNVGLTYKLCQEMGDALSVYYEPGLQWSNWRSALDVASGKGINRQIRRAYKFLAKNYRPGDRIFLMGYSRGAYAVRSLGGLVDQVGLLRPMQATDHNISEAYEFYQNSATSEEANAFRKKRCVPEVEIEMIGVWDTVKSLGLNAPIFWRLSTARHAFHNHDLSSIVRNGFHALAIDETRVVFKPILWANSSDGGTRVEQVWFPGTHGDVGGQIYGHKDARPLSNIPLVWMLENAQSVGLPLPEAWGSRFPQDAKAPSVGKWRGFGKIFVTRRKRKIGLDPSERIHPSHRIRISDIPAGALRRVMRMTGRAVKEAQNMPAAALIGHAPVEETAAISSS